MPHGGERYPDNPEFADADEPRSLASAAVANAPVPVDAGTRAWLRALPKVELHVHLEGSLTPATIGRLASRHGADTEAVWPGGLPEHFEFDGFPSFARQFRFGLSLIRSGPDLADIVVALAGDLASHNVRYAEVITTAYLHHDTGMPAREYKDALDEGRRRAATEHGVALAWIVDIPREMEPPDSEWTARFLESPDAPDGLVGIGIGGPEVGYPPELFASSFARARANGLRSIPHAGETVGPPSIVGALDALHADRIGHGVRCLDDDALVARIADAGTMLDVCPTSNVLLGVCTTIEQHVIGALVERGVRVSVNTDDPGYFATDLTRELELVHAHHGIALAQLVAMQRDALDASFAPPDVRARIASELAAVTAPTG